MGVVPASRKTRYPAIPVPASVDAVHVNAICVADCAVAVSPCGTVGGVLSTGTGPGEGGGGLGEEPPPPPQPARNDASAWHNRPVAIRGAVARIRVVSNCGGLEGPQVVSSSTQRWTPA